MKDKMIKDLLDEKRQETLTKVKEFINHQIDAGNLVNEKGFSASICLSDLLKWINKELK